MVVEYENSKFGRIKYVEPNDFIENSEFNHVHPYEDYSISVDLLVKIPNRIYNIKVGNNFQLITSKGFEDITTTFFGGTDGYMTDTPGTLVYQDILNKDVKGINESLGITNINITYNSYFYPEVTIQFTDVRANALMTPNEEIYETIAKEGQPQVQNFFASLFSFPYPEFKLRVKGFYGKKVEYSLLVTDFRSSFNNQTGNFDVTAKFIGRMFGVYTDIPMLYLIIAPYCKYGGNEEESIWDKKQFTFDNGTPIPTLLELRKLLQNAEYNQNDLISEEDSNTYKTGQQKVAKLVQLKEDCIHELFSLMKIDGVYNCQNNVYLLPENEKDSLPTPLIQLYQEIEKSGIGVNINGIKLSTDNKYIVDESYKISFNKENGNNSYSMNNKEKFIETIEKELETALHSIKIEHNSKYYIISGKELIENLNTQINDTRAENNNKYESILTKLDQDIINLLGFKPTVKNIFQIVMAHLQVFMEIYNTFILNVTNENARTLEKIGVLSANISDLPFVNINDITIPPFPAFKNLENNTYCYPTDVSSAEDIEETILIDELLKGIDNVVEIIRQLEAELETLRNTIDEENTISIPTCLTDFVTSENPYVNVFNKEDNNYIAWLMTYFGIRCILNFIVSQNNIAMDYNVFGQGEAMNFFVANQELDETIKSLLKSEEFNEINFIKFLTNNSENNPYIQEGKPVYQNDDKTSSLVKKSGTQLHLSDTFNFSGALTNIDNFWSHTNGTAQYSLFKGNAAAGFPYEYFKEVKNDKFDQLLKNCQEIDSSKSTKFTSAINSNTAFENPFLNKFYFKRFGDLGEIERFEKNVIICFNKNTPSTANLNNVVDTAEGLGNNKYVYSLYDSYNNNETVIGCVLCDNKPFFMMDNITPEKLLTLIPHNIKYISNKLYKGNTIINIPYSTQLFIGMILENGFSYLNDTVLNNDTYYGLDKLFYSICRNSNGAILSDYLYKNEYNLENQTDRGIYFKFLRELNFQNIFDVFGFKEKYKSWKEEFKNVINGYHLSKINNVDIVSHILEHFARKESVTPEILDGHYNTSREVSSRYKYIILVDDDQVVPIFNENFEHFSKLNELFYKYDKFVVPYKISDYKTYFNFKFSENNRNNFMNSLKPDYSELTFDVDAVNSGTIPNFNNQLQQTQSPLTSSVSTEESNETTILLSCTENELTGAFKSFKNKLFELYGFNNTETQYNPDRTRQFKVTEETKLSMYLTLKNLYDKHLHNLPSEIVNYDITNESSEFKRFHFVDSFFNDLSDELCVNVTKLNEVIQAMIGGYEDKQNGILESTMNLYSFLALICEKSSMLFMSMPFFNGSFMGDGGDETMKAMFKPISYNESATADALVGPGYVCLYPHQPSRHLDLPNSQYSNDGFNITEPYDMNDTANFSGPTDIVDLNTEGKYVIPAFGVEYGSQKQSIFKNINVNMDNPQTTEASVANQFMLASKAADVYKLGFEGQDLFRIYSNYSYSCQVEMMGCAQVQPLMYFQLNNIPMFRGAYQIIHVEHNITPGNMSTTFRGVRMNKTKIPMVKTCIAAELPESIMANKTMTIQRNIMLTPSSSSGTYYGSNNLTDGFEANTKASMLDKDNISKYDVYFKKYASIPGVDWRLLAAIGYTESGFDPTAKSGVAHGIMQLHQKFYSAFGIDKNNRYQPEPNIKAGAEILKEKINAIKYITTNENELIKFALAAYNGGQGMVNKAYKKCKDITDTSIWENVKPYISSEETRLYIGKVLSAYKYYCSKIPE